MPEIEMMKLLKNYKSEKLGKVITRTELRGRVSGAEIPPPPPRKLKQYGDIHQLLGSTLQPVHVPPAPPSRTLPHSGGNNRRLKHCSCA